MDPDCAKLGPGHSSAHERNFRGSWRTKAEELGRFRRVKEEVFKPGGLGAERLDGVYVLVHASAEMVCKWTNGYHKGSGLGFGRGEKARIQLQGRCMCGT